MSSEPQPEFTLTARSADGKELRVAFAKLGDRWQHTVHFVREGNDRVAGTSLEGSPEESWPPSPPLQSISLETIDGRQVALGVGMAGTCHWSLSVEPVADAAAFVFDWACRVDRLPQWLGSTYEVAGPIRFMPLAIDGVSASYNRTADWVTLQPAPAKVEGRATIRWKYRVESL